MDKQNDFRELLMEPEIEAILTKVEAILNQDCDSGDASSDKEIWGSNNNITVSDVPRLFTKLQQENIIPTDLSLQYTQFDEDQSFEDTNPRFILMDALKPIFLIWFDDVIDKNDSYYEGLIKEGFIKILKAALFYHQYNETSLDRLM